MRPIAFAAAFCVLTAGAVFAQAPEPPAPAAPATAPPPANPPMTGPRLLVQTSAGEFTLQLDDVRSPQSVAHILRMTRAGHYNGSSIYRVEKNFVIQMGSWDADGKGKGWFPRPIPLEANNGLKNYRLAVALPRDDRVPTSAGPDFYINMRDNLELDQKPDDTANTTGFAVFGHVASGIEVVEAINNVTVGGGKGPFAASEPSPPIIITRVAVVGDPPPRPAAATAKPAAPAARASTQARPAQAKPASAKPEPAKRTN